MALNFETVKTNLYTWAISVVPALTPVIFANENSPRPALPYVTLYLTSLVQIGEDWTPKPDNAGGAEMVGDREFTLQIQCYGGDPITILENVRSSLQKQSVLDTLRANGIVFVNHFPISDVTQLLDTEYEARGTMDVLFRIAQLNTDDLGKIETVEVQEILSDGNAEVWNETVTITAL